MVKEDLTSDRVNYLIWRYLQESNYTDTALTLAREWNHSAPRDDFDPKEHVKHQTLVTILQKGLIYDDLERSIGAATGQPAEAAVSHGFFGPLLSPPTPPQIADDEYDNQRKRSTDQRDVEVRAPSPSKRQRFSNGSVSQHAFEVTPMDIDDHGDSNGLQQNGQNGHAYPSPPPKDSEEEEARSPIAFATNGPETGYQPEKPMDMTSNTIFLSSVDSTTTNPLHVLHADWHPHDSAILAAAGDQALVHFWKTSLQTASSNLPHSHVNGASKTPHWLIRIDGESHRKQVTVSAFSWSPSGDVFAVACDSEEDDFANVSIYNLHGTLQQSYTSLIPPVLSLDWSNDGKLVLAYSSTERGDSFHVFQSFHHGFAQISLPPSGSPTALRLVWTGDFEFTVCGGTILRSYAFQNGTIELTKKHELREDHHNLTEIAFDPSTGFLATATEAGEIDIWNEVGERSQTILAHDSGILSLAWQPLRTVGLPSGRLLASCSEDGSIAVWDTTSAGSAKGATSSRVTIWSMDNLSVPKAYWNRNLMLGNESPKSGVDQTEDAQILKWDVNGEKLAFAVNTLVAVLNFSSALRHSEVVLRPQQHPLGS